MKRKSSILPIILYAIGLIFAIEILLRFMLAPAVFPSQMLDYDKDLWFKLKPNNNVIFEGGLYKIKPTHVNTNSLGLRDSEYAFNHDKYRIAFLGDSMTFGQAVESNETFVKIIEKEKNVEAINFGVPGYTPYQEKIQYEILAKKFKPNLTILVFISNDLEAPQNYADPSFFGKIRSLLRFSYIARWTYYEYYLRTYSAAAKKTVNMSDSFTKKNLDSIVELAKETKADGSDFAVFIFPPFRDNAFFDEYSKTIIELGNKNGFRVINPKNVFLNESVENLAVRSDGHPTVYAHSLIAKALLADLG